MKYFFKIMIYLFFLSNNSFALESENKTTNDIEKIKDKSKNIFKTLTRKSLSENQTLKFLSEYIIIIDDKKGDGTVIYYFEDHSYKRYKDLEVISQDAWEISKIGQLRMFDINGKETWKIQIGKENIINIKKGLNLIGKMFKFSYSNKTDFHLKLVEKKIKDD